MAVKEEQEEEEEIVAGAGADEEKAIVLVGAADEEQKAIVPVGTGNEEGKENGAGGGGGKGKGKEIANDGQLTLPPGFRFRPGDDELVRYYLLPKLQGREHVPNHNIIVADVYQYHPAELTDKYRTRGGECWYFLSPRARKYRNGDRPSRSTDDNRGRWKASTATSMNVAVDGETKYRFSSLVYWEGTPREESKTKWLMKELTVPAYENQKLGKNDDGSGQKDMLDQYVMCKVYGTTRSRRNDDEAGPSGTKSELAESGEGTSAVPAQLSEKQAGKRKAAESGEGATAGRAVKRAGKRKAEEQPMWNATATAPKREYLIPDYRHLGPLAPLHAGNGMQGPFMTPGYYGGGPGQPMGYNARPPMPRPPVVHHSGQVAFNGQARMPPQPAAFNGQGPRPRQQAANNGQAPVPLQAVGFNGQARVPVPRQHAAYNGNVPGPLHTVVFNGQVRAPVPRQQAAYNSQVMRGAIPRPQVAYNSQVMRGAIPRPQVAYNGQAPIPRPQVAYNGQVPQYPAGQAVNQPSPVVPRPAEQPETEEMRKNRVLRQNMEAIILMQSSARPPASAADAAQQQRQMMAFRQQHRPMMPFTQQQQQQERQMMAFTHQQRQMMPFTQHHQQQQRPYFGGNASYHEHAGAMVPRFSLENFSASEGAQHYERTRAVVPAACSPAGSSAEGLGSPVVSGPGGEESGANLDCSIDDWMKFLEDAPAADGDGPRNDSAQ